MKVCQQSLKSTLKHNKISLHVALFSFFLTHYTCNHIIFFIIGLISNCSFAFNCSITGLCPDIIDFQRGGGVGWTKRVLRSKKGGGGKQYQGKTETVAV